MTLKKYKAEKQPYLNDYNGDLSKRWYIDYWIYNTDTQLHDKARYWIPSDRTLKKRRERIREALAEIEKLLDMGAMKGKAPYEPDKNFDPEDLTFKAASTYFTNYKNGTLEGYGSDKLCDKWNPETSRVRQKTWSNYKGVFFQFQQFLKKHNRSSILMQSVTVQLARTFMEDLKKKKLSNKRINVIRDTLSGLYNHFNDLEDMDLRNPFAKVEKLVNKTSEKHPPFSQDQLRQIVEFCEADEAYAQLLLFIRFIYYTLARPYEEIRTLQVKDIGPKQIFIKAENHKTWLSRRIDIPPGLEEEIVKHRIREFPKDNYVFGKCEAGLLADGSPATPADAARSDTSLYTQHRKVLTALGLEDYTLYGYKHTGAIAVYKATKDIIRVRDMCGHTSVSTTEIYLRGLGAIENTVANVEKF